MSANGKVAAVTGAGSGIGRGIAVALAAAGARVVANDVDPAGLDETLGSSATRARRASPRSATSPPGDVQRIVDDAVASFGGLDVMVANAAVGIYVDLEQMTRTTSTASSTSTSRARWSAPSSRSRRCGRAAAAASCSSSSVQAFATLRGCVAYGATKAGLVAATRALAVEVGEHGIRVQRDRPGHDRHADARAISTG